MNGVIFQAGDQKYKPFFEISSPLAKEYAKKINCDYKLFISKGPTNRHPSWGKVYALRDLLLEFDWALLLDGDALIINHNINITKCLKTKHHIYVCSDGVGKKPWNFNAGVMLFKSSMLTKHFTKNIINTKFTEFYFNRNWEQNAMHNEIKENYPLYKDKIKIHNSNFFNHDSRFIYHPVFGEGLSDSNKIEVLKSKARSA
jgi:hypothetical protein